MRAVKSTAHAATIQAQNLIPPCHDGNSRTERHARALKKLPPCLRPSVCFPGSRYNVAMKSASTVFALFVTGVVVTGIAAHQTPQRYDLLIRNARVLDGTGNPWFPADIAVQNGRIAAVGTLPNAQAAKVVDATGKYVTPGFIDIHSHADDGSGPRGGFRDPDPIRRSAPNLVSQGITTVVVNQDGRSPWPVREQRAQLEKTGIGPNAMLLVGHGTVRRRVMGDDTRRPARPEEIANMRTLVRQALTEGAVGMSAGLEYEPGRWSTTDEVVELARELPAVNGIYISHERSEGSDPLWYVPSQDGPVAPTLLDAVRETIEIGERPARAWWRRT
jgi:N-acyl-D-amino-acid deacylase